MDLISFLKKRFSKNEKYGLSLTIGAAVSLLFAWFFYVVAEDLIGKETLYHADLRIINLVALYRTGTLNKVMLAITYLGKWEIIFLGVLFVAIILAIQKKWIYFWTLIASVVGGQIIVTIIKNVFHRARPPFINALVIENSYSFPSGHSLVAVTFYGFMTYLIYKNLKSKIAKTLTIIIGIFVILAIGFSRIYLGAHFPSDVLAGYLIGAAWVTTLVTALEIFKPKVKDTRFMLSKKALYNTGLVLFVVWLGFWGLYTHNHPLITNPEHIEIINLNQSQIPTDLFVNLPKTSETLTGQPMEPINIIVVGDKSELDKSFADAGWFKTDKVTLNSSLRIAVDVILKKPYPNAPGTPSFWNYRPNEFAYEFPTGKDPSQRYHIHFWETPFTLNGTPIWFATAHFDKSVFFKDYVIPTHQIDPNVDLQRTKVLNDLVKTGDVANTQEFQLVSPLTGKNAAGSLFTTDGKTEIIFLK